MENLNKMSKEELIGECVSLLKENEELVDDNFKMHQEINKLKREKAIQKSQIRELGSLGSVIEILTRY